jgi:uncharacterized surface anchored protein
VANLPPGSYTVVQTLPSDYLATTPTTANVTLTSGSMGAANYLDTQPASISGMVLVDVNGDGVADAADTNGISGVTIVLQTTNGVPVATNLTSDSGTYFTNVPPGDYTVVQMVPPGWLATATTNITVTLTSGQASTNNNFLDTQPAGIAGSVKLDVNGNGVADAEDTNGVSPVVLNVYLNGTTLVATVTNNSDGSFSVANLPPGSYTVVQTLPSDYLATTPTTASVTLTSGSMGAANYLDTQPLILAITLTSTQGSLLTLSVTPGQYYTLLATTNLLAPITAWSVVSTGTAPVGPFMLTDPEATNFPQRFYRARTP